MSPRRLALWHRRIELVRESGALRERLVEHSQAFAPVLGWADAVRGGLRWAKDHPAVPLAGILLLLWRRPMSLIRWGTRIWAARKFVRRIAEFWGELGGRK